MASSKRNKNAPVKCKGQAPFEALAQDPYHFGFYEALRQLECWYRHQPRLGESARPAQDPIRLGQAPSLKFAPATLASFQCSDERPARLGVYCFGLFGPNGPLPLHLTQYAHNRLHHARDPVLMEFMDLFHHRLLSLFYRAWANKEPTVQFDRPEQDRFAQYVGSLLGLGMPSLRQRDAMPDLLKLHFSAHLASHNRHAEGLVAIVGAFFRLPVKLVEFVGEWLDIPKESYCTLDRSDTAGQLGRSAVIGTRSWQRQHKFRIRLGPLSLKDYEHMLPGGSGLQRLVAIVRNYTGFEFRWDLALVLKKEQVPTAQPGEYGRLGWTTWLKAEERCTDADDLQLNAEAYFAGREG